MCTLINHKMHDHHINNIEIQQFKYYSKAKLIEYVTFFNGMFNQKTKLKLY